MEIFDENRITYRNLQGNVTKRAAAFTSWDIEGMKLSESTSPLMRDRAPLAYNYRVGQGGFPKPVWPFDDDDFQENPDQWEVS